MKTKYIIASLGLATLLSFGANAAVHQVNAEQAQNLQPMGTISVSQIGSTPMDDAPRDNCAHFREINGTAAAFQYLQKNYNPTASSFL